MLAMTGVTEARLESMCGGWCGCCCCCCCCIDGCDGGGGGGCCREELPAKEDGIPPSPVNRWLRRLILRGSMFNTCSPMMVFWAAVATLDSDGLEGPMSDTDSAEGWLVGSIL